MVSRRNFFSICIMMIVILFMFMFLLIIRDFQNDYDTNIHRSDTGLTQADLSVSEDAQTVVYIGSSEKAVADIVCQWGNYTKRQVVQYNSLQEYERLQEDAPVLLCIAGSEIDNEGEVEILDSLASEGMPMIFCDLPDVTVMRQLQRLRDLLGIQKIQQEEVELTGVKLFSGFLLGGEVIYQAQTEKEQKMQDMDLTVPWYYTLRGTKTYMVGLLEDETVENEYLPGLIWRNGYHGTHIFAVNGTYMYDQTGLGILDAVMYELQDYELHPVVNAQNLSVVSYPDFAMENTEILTEIYARNLRRLQMDLMWPNLIAAANKSDYIMTCFLTPQLDYVTKGTLLPEDLIFYLKEFKEQNAEAGLSLDYLPGINLQEKLEKDQSFFAASGSSYPYGAAYINEADRDALSALTEKGLLETIQTITGVGSATDPLLAYCTDTILQQGVTANGFSHSYLQDLRVRSLETALGYSNILLDMKEIFWPAEDADHWEVLYEAFSSNINTFWHPFSMFEKTALSESDARARSFLAMDYKETRDGDTITMEISKQTEEVWFLLRTHSESICGITGGEYEKIEEGAYLICAQEDRVEIQVESNTQLTYPLS